MTDALNAIRYIIKQGVPAVTVLSTIPLGLVDHYVSAGYSPEQIYRLIYGPHRVTLRRKPDRRRGVV